VAFGRQSRSQQRSDEAARAGDEDAHRSDDDGAAPRSERTSGKCGISREIVTSK
jgi:hypothetical protein